MKPDRKTVQYWEEWQPVEQLENGVVNLKV